MVTPGGDFRFWIFDFGFSIAEWGGWQGPRRRADPIPAGKSEPLTMSAFGRERMVYGPTAVIQGKGVDSSRVLADLPWIAQATTCDHGRETRAPPEGWSRTGEAPSFGRKADQIALTGEVRGFPRLNRRPYGRGHGAQQHGDA